MTHRTDRVWIPDSEERCNPQFYCQDKTRCGRYLAPIKQGSAMGDHSRALGVLFLHCPHMLPLNLKPEKQAQPVKDWPT